MTQKGQILALSVVIVGIVLASTMALVTGSMVFFESSHYTVEGSQAIDLAEAGLDKAIASLNASGGGYAGESESILGPGVFSVTVSTLDGNTKLVQSTGYIPAKTNARVHRTIQMKAAKGIGAAFHYGVQVGEGGMEMGSNNNVIGSFYSNGNVTSVNANQITGDVFVGAGTAPSPDQTTDCSASNCTDFIFGTAVSGNNIADLAQSLQLSKDSTLNKVQLKIKKIGNPADINIRILADRSGAPDKNNVLASGTLYANLVTTSYGWVDVAFPTSPTFSGGTTYWIMADSSISTSDYWSWQLDSLQSYTKGAPAWTVDWQAGNAVWRSIIGDLSFATYIGGSPTSIDGGNGFTVLGNVHANTIKNATIQKAAYYQSISNVTAGEYFPSSADPAPQPFPISDGNITSWQSQAQQAGVTNGSITHCVLVLGPGKIVGNVEFDNKCKVTVKSPVWITGNFDLENNNTLTLSSDFGSASGVILVDGITTFNNGNLIQGTGIGTSILMLLSNYDSRTSGVSAIVLKNTGNSSFLYAGKGIIEPGNSNTFKELTGWGIKLFSSSSVNYETGLASAFFSSGPSGSYSLVKGTYQFK